MELRWNRKHEVGLDRVEKAAFPANLLQHLFWWNNDEDDEDDEDDGVSWEDVNDVNHTFFDKVWMGSHFFW